MVSLKNIITKRKHKALKKIRTDTNLEHVHYYFFAEFHFFFTLDFIRYNVKSS